MFNIYPLYVYHKISGHSPDIAHPAHPALHPDNYGFYSHLKNYIIIQFYDFKIYNYKIIKYIVMYKFD